jgi:hypothetical protein
LLGPLNSVLVPATNGPSRLYVFRTSMSAATNRVDGIAGRDRAGGRRLKDELIVTLGRDGKGKIDELAARLGAKVIGRSDELGAYRLKFENEAAADAARAKLESGDSGAGAFANYLMDQPDSPEGLLASGTLGLGLKARPATAGEGVVVGLVDTGVQGEAAGIKDFLLPGISVAGQASPQSNELEHGTSMAATLLRGLASAPDAAQGSSVRILPVDVYGGNASTTTYEMALGIQAAINNGASIVNLSLGGDEASPFIQRLIRAGREQGVIFLAAAGNEPVAAPTYPAAYPEVIAVTALDRRGDIAPYANYGNFVDVGALGTSYVNFNGQPYRVVGTSPATAYASAMAAAIASATGKRGADLEAEIRRALAVNPAELAPSPAPGP